MKFWIAYKISLNDWALKWSVLHKEVVAQTSFKLDIKNLFQAQNWALVNCKQDSTSLRSQPKWIKVTCGWGVTSGSCGSALRSHQQSFWTIAGKNVKESEINIPKQSRKWKSRRLHRCSRQHSIQRRIWHCTTQKSWTPRSNSAPTQKTHRKFKQLRTWYYKVTNQAHPVLKPNLIWMIFRNLWWKVPADRGGRILKPRQHRILIHYVVQYHYCNGAVEHRLHTVFFAAR